MTNNSDTICALATPPGVGGLAVIRVSGPKAIEVCNHFLRSHNDLTTVPSHTIHYGWWTLNNAKIDTVTCSVFVSPTSYTGEDVVEIGCHGGWYASEQILESLVATGVRPAQAGEFTKRAFVNGKMDLTQVEAVADLIHAQSKIGAQISARQLASGFTVKLNLLKDFLRTSCGLMELELDFSEENIEFVNRAQLLANLENTEKELVQLLDTAQGAEILRSGIHCVLVGFPNAGKSSLFNALLRKQRAIVSSTPGTTRDYIEDAFIHDGVTIHLYDTAGIRDTSDSIELEGIQLARSIMDQADLILVVNDAVSDSKHSVDLLHGLKDLYSTTGFIFVQNKSDLAANSSSAFRNEQVLVVHTSAVSEHGCAGLLDEITRFAQRRVDKEADALLNQRQTLLLKQALASVLSAKVAIHSNLSPDLVSVDMRTALRLLGEVTGDSWNQDVLDAVFSNFCIGK